MVKQFTSASANKHLKRLEEEKNHILTEERATCTYVLSAGEEEEPPAYDYESVRSKVDALDAEVLKVRHAIHVFNAITVLPKCGLTIDEALISMAQMNVKKNRLASLRDARPKERSRSGLFGRESNVVEYTYANYDIAKADADYQEVCARIVDLQLELDLVNQTQVFEVDL